MNPFDYLLLGVEQYLRELSDDDFAELVERTRPPAGDSPTNATASFVRSLLGGRDD